MKTNEMTMMGNTFTTVLLGILAVLLVGLTLYGKKIPFVTSEKAALFWLVMLGMAMCTRGIGRVAATGQWAHPLAILAYIIGAAILIIGITLWLGKPISIITTPRQALIAITLLGGAKMIVSGLHHYLF